VTGLEDKNIVGIAAGGGNTAALQDDGTLWTWGYNAFGQLGIGTVGNSSVPVKANIEDVIDISIGKCNPIDSNTYGFMVALKSDGTVWSWGDNTNHQLGDTTTVPRYAPAQVKQDITNSISFTDVKDIAAGEKFVVILKNDGEVWGWGENGLGELGYTPKWSYSPNNLSVNRFGNLNASAIAAGIGNTMILMRDGTLLSLGGNGVGQLGINSRNITSADPQNVVYQDGGVLRNIQSIAVGYDHTLALSKRGELFSWGNNPWLQLGNESRGKDYYTVNYREYALKVMDGVGLDTTAPTAITYSPEKDSVGSGTNDDISLTFSENISGSAGKYLTIKKKSDDTVVEKIEVTDAQKVTVNGTAVSVNPAAILDEDTSYYVLIDQGAFKDASDNEYSGISDNAEWSFKTAKNYTMSFDSKEGSSVAAITAKEGSKLTAPTAPIRDGYLFGGWYKEAGCINVWDFASDTVTSATTLYAKWAILKTPLTSAAINGTAKVGQTLTATVAPGGATAD